MVIHVDDDDNYEVGYRKPPTRTRFKPGQSGNPKGRRRQKPKLCQDYINEVLETKIAMNVNGKETEVPITKALLWALAKKGINGCSKSAKLLLDVSDKFSTLIHEERERTELKRESDQRLIDQVREELHRWT